MNPTISYERYHRQLILKGFGEAGQQKLLRAKVLVIGAGGLGCPALQYLAGAGVGTIGIVDGDQVSLSNLHRQVLFSVNDIGLPKAETAAKKLQLLNPEIQVLPYPFRLTVENALEIISGFDMVIDGTDNFSSRYMINDACVLLDKPLVYGAVSQFEGQVSVFNDHSQATIVPVNYRDLFPEPPGPDEAPNCSEAGVLGVLPGIIGIMQACEALKLITRIGSPLSNTLLAYNALNNKQYELKLFARPGSKSLIPADAQAFKKMNYDWFCAPPVNEWEITAGFFDELLKTSGVVVIDVREPDEMPEIHEFSSKKIPLGQLIQHIPCIEENTVVTVCQSGKRSLQAAKQLADVFGKSKSVYSLQGGIVQWKERNQEQRSKI